MNSYILCTIKPAEPPNYIITITTTGVLSNCNKRKNKVL